jgi:hypothetical protein
MLQSPPNLSANTLPASSIGQNDVFISYCRRDKAFVEKLYASLQQANRNPWVDWDDIYKGEDWWKSIQKGIEQADSFVFVISPDSVVSQVCREEVEYAAKLNKRILPLLWREGFEMAQVHRPISQHNWIFARDSDNFQKAFQELLTALDTDLDHVRAHTRLLVRSLEWQNRQRNSSYLLRGMDLDDAQYWLEQGINKQPRPTDAQVAYIQASQEARTTALKAHQKAKWIVVLTTVIANLLLVSGGLFFINKCVNDIARAHVEKSMQATLQGALAGINGDEFEQLARLTLRSGSSELVNNPLNDRHQAWLNTINQIAPVARPTTYIWKPDGRILAIGNGIQPTSPKNFNLEVLPNRVIKPQGLGELNKVTINLTPFRDSSGSSWVSIYGPIHNNSGRVVGILGLAYDSTYWTDLEDHIREVMTITSIGAFIWVIISSAIILRATKPKS